MPSKRMSRRGFLRGAAIAAAGTAAAACQPQTVIVEGTPKIVEKEVTKIVEKEVEKVVTATQSIDTSEAVTLNFALYGTPSFIHFGDAAKALFEKEYPNATLEMEYWAGGDQEFLDSIIARLVAGNPPDAAFAGGYSWVDDFATRGALLDLRPFMDLLPQSEVDDFYPGPLKLFEGKTGEQWGIPLPVFGEACGIWKPAFEEAGIPLPADDWTWDNLREAAQRLTKVDDQGRVVRWGYRLNGYDTWHLGIPVWAYGGDWFDETYSQFLGDSPEALAGLKVIYDMIWQDHSSPSAAELSDLSGDSYSEFAAGRTAIWMQGSWFYGNIRDKLSQADEEMQLAWDIARLPKGPAGRVTPVAGNPVYAFRATKSPQWAWELVKFWSGTEVQSLYTFNFGTDMSRKSASAAAKAPGKAPEHAERVAEQFAEASVPQPTPPHFAEVSDAFSQYLGSAFLEGETSLESALDETKQKINAILAQPG